MKKLFSIAFIAASLLALQQPLSAQLIDCWAPANWTINQNNTTTAPVIFSTLITLDNDMDFVGSGLDSIDCNETEGTSTICISVPETGDFTFTWSTAGAPFFYNPFIDRFGYCLNGVVTELNSASPPPFGTSSGTHTVSLQAGDDFCFIYASKFSDVPTPLTVSINNFVTPGCPTATCDASTVVTGSSTDALLPNGKGAALSWDATPLTDAYQLEGGPTGGPLKRTVLTPNNINIGGLTPGTEYEWRVRARCAASGIITAWSPFTLFTTPNPRQGTLSTTASVWPNPASEVLFIEHASGESPLVTARLLNSMGQLVATVTPQTGQNVISVDVSALPAGVYFLEGQTEAGSWSTPVLVD